MESKKYDGDKVNRAIDSLVNNKPTRKGNNFLICGNCFWMVSALSVSTTNKNKMGNTKCPICAYKTHNFFI